MRRVLVFLVAGVGLLGAAPAAVAAPAAMEAGLGPAAAAQAGLGPKALRHALAHDLGAIGGVHGVYVLDLTTRRQLFAVNPGAGRMPASVQKLYTTSTALLRFGPASVLTTSVLGTGRLKSSGTWQGTLYLRGSGDPTFGSQSFDQSAYGKGVGATVGQLARALHNAGIKGLTGRIVGDESRFDSLRGTVATGFKPSLYLEGQLSALSYDRGFSNSTWTAFQSNPPKYAATEFGAGLRTIGVNVPSSTRFAKGKTPRRARPLAAVKSPPIATLIRLTNSPSDNFLAETLLKDLGASFGGGGTTAAGAGVVHRELKNHFHINPRFNDGSGLSRYDSTSPHQVVKLLERMDTNTNFVGSLAIAGKTGTLKGEMRGTRAQGRCRGKTGTLHDVASLAGYCTARDGHTLAFAFLLNRLSDSNFGHAVEAKMAVALANYTG